VLWIRLRHRIDRELLDAAPRLKIIVSPTTGLNHIDLSEAERRGIQVISLRGEHEFLRDVRATAELTVGLILAIVRHIPAAADHARAGGWDRDQFKGHELCGRTLGLVGYGRLGRIVGRYMQAFDMRVVAADPSVTAAELEPGIELLPLDELLKQSDVVSLHANLDDRTAGFFGRREFGAMKPGAWFVNTARGELIDEAALVEAIESGQVAAAAVDVVSNERATGMAGHPLIEFARRDPRLLITPHIGGCTVESLAKTEAFLAEKLIQALSSPVCHANP
jgi:D-3-phosphoglycerate dehydrogenase